jgi:type II secretory ATPase GspE/PulE/Tfp pilus assembly ATPase PilB-like protein
VAHGAAKELTMKHSTDGVLVPTSSIVDRVAARAEPQPVQSKPQIARSEPVKLHAVPSGNMLAQWPAPALSPWAPGEMKDGPERAHLETLRDGPMKGEVLMLGESRGLFFRPNGAHGAHWVGFSDLQRLVLTRPLAFAAPPSCADELRRRYRVVLVDGTVMEGESSGAVRWDSALFLYPPTGDAAVTRLLIPAHHVRSFDWVEGAHETVRLEIEEVGPAMEPPPERVIASIPALLEALDKVGQSPVRRLGEALVEMNILTPAQLAQALERQRVERLRFRKHVPLGKVLLDMRVVNPDQLQDLLVRKLGILRVDVLRFLADPAAVRLVPRVQCHRHRVLPLCLDARGRLVVAMDDPMSNDALEAVRFSSGRRAVPVLAGWRDIRVALGSFNAWEGEATAETAAHALPSTGADDAAPEAIEFDLSGFHELTSRLTLEAPAAGEQEPADAVRESDSTLVRLVNKVILDAMESGASDIHIEPASGNRPTRIRMRRDGALSDYAEIPARFRSAIVSRIKVMASLDIAEHRKHQDGKIDFSRFGPAKLELRVATIPTVNGLESVVLRLLASSKPLPVDKLCLGSGVLERLREVVEKPHGLLLVCGPTGSGKTTTLHSLMSLINTPERKIWTAEDPIEITQDGLSQVQVNPKIGWTFAETLRSLLRADPDVIMIGEIRDRETAQAAVEASLTGHLVFSTLHTNSAPETVARLLDLGVDPFKFGDSLLGVLAQRLVRRVCPACARPIELREDESARMALEYADGTETDPSTLVADWRQRLGKKGRLYAMHSAGCESCGGSGFKGRLGLHEFMGTSAALRKLVHRRAEPEAVRERALAEGMRTLRQDGIEKTLMGLTTVKQVRAACG